MYSARQEKTGCGEQVHKLLIFLFISVYLVCMEMKFLVKIVHFSKMILPF